MKVALIGITGQVGSRLMAELLSRGHTVTGIARRLEKAKLQPGLDLKQDDATNPSSITNLIGKPQCSHQRLTISDIKRPRTNQCGKRSRHPSPSGGGRSCSLLVGPGKL